MECKSCEDVNAVEGVAETTEQNFGTKKRGKQRRGISLYCIYSSENLTSFFVEDVSGSGSISRDGRPWDDGIILVILEKRRGAKEVRLSVRRMAEDRLVEVDVDTFVKDGVLDVRAVCSDGNFFIAGLGGGMLARERWAGLVAGFVGPSGDIDRPRPLADLRCGVRDRCRPIDICSTVGTRPGRSS
jgi:hypothetical protein